MVKHCKVRWSLKNKFSQIKSNKVEIGRKFMTDKTNKTDKTAKMEVVSKEMDKEN